MEGLPLAAIVSQAIARREITSALPDAPVVPDVPREPRVRAVRSRIALAGMLQKAAAAVAPPARGCPTPSGPTATGPAH